MKLIVYQCTDFFSGNHFFQVAYCIHIEYYDRQIILLTHTSSCQVHHFQSSFQHFIVSDVVELGCRRIFLRVGSLDTVYASTFQHDVCFYFDTAKR